MDLRLPRVRDARKLRAWDKCNRESSWEGIAGTASLISSLERDRGRRCKYFGG